MPELPDLQVASRNLHRLYSGKVVKKVKVGNGKNLEHSEKELQAAIRNKKLVKVYREGKELRFLFGDTLLGLHLMLHGEIKTFEGRNENKFTIIEFQFADDTGIALADWQVQAHVWLNPEEPAVPDALSGKINAGFLKSILDSRAKVKSVLTDQKQIRGIGNAYADEILWKARISPFSIARCIPDEKIKVLARSIKSVLTQAEKQILKSNPDLVGGEVRDFLSIHNAKKETSPTGKPIKFEKVGGRKTYYTDEQELFD